MKPLINHLTAWSWVIILSPCLIEAQSAPDSSLWFGYPFFQPSYTTSVFDLDPDFELEPLGFATVNIRFSGDLLRGDVLFFHPDLVSPGREVYQVSAGENPAGTRVFWRQRPFRDPYTSLSDFTLIPPSAIGGLRATHWGALNGAIRAGAVVDLSPVTSMPSEPLTSFQYREGFYDFGPVEFVHLRPLGRNTMLTAGGFIPASGSRFAHASYSGMVVYGDLMRTLSERGSLRCSYMFGKHRTEIPFSILARSQNRNDWDAEYEHRYQSGTGLETGIYHSSGKVGISGVDRDYRETGARLAFSRGNCGVLLRLSGLTGNGGPNLRRVRSTEIEGVVGYAGAVKRFSWRFLLGAYGFLPKRAALVGAVSGEWQIPQVCELDVIFRQACDPHSLGNQADRDSTWSLGYGWEEWSDPSLAAGSLPLTLERSCKVGANRQLPLGQVEVAAFYSQMQHPVVWVIRRDSTFSAASLDRRWLLGWTAAWSVLKAPFRGTISAVGFSRDSKDLNSSVFFFPEPRFRMLWETGWHRSYWGNQFEADLSLSGKFYQRFFTYGAGSWQPVGGAYPMDFRLTFRIRRFNFYWGVHNFNSYQYWLVPGYKMMHKEEYWGVNWLMLD